MKRTFHLPKTAGMRVVTAVVIAGIAFAGIFAFAASITVSPSSLGAGSSVTSACDSSIGVTYPTPTFVNGSGYDTTACAGKTIYVQLADSSNNAITNGDGSVAVPASGTTATVTLTGATA